MAPRRSDKELLLAVKLGVSLDDLPQRLSEMKGGLPYWKLADMLKGMGVPVDTSWLSRFFARHGLSEPRPRRPNRTD